MFVSRIIGLRAGKVVYDGPPSGLDQEILMAIYGEEDWTALSAKYKEDEEEDARAAVAMPSRDKLQADV
jgi:phosphonate transport system ATP-binding protein